MTGVVYQGPRGIAIHFELDIVQVCVLLCDSPSIQVHDGSEIVKKRNILKESVVAFQGALIQGLQYIIRK